MTDLTVIKDDGAIETEAAAGSAAEAPFGEDKKTLGASIADDIRSDIVAGKIEPGTQLRFGDLKTRYGASVSPLRDALLRLVADGLVTLRGQQGFRVAPLSVGDIKDVTVLRKMLECLALRRSIEFGGVDWEANIVRAFHVLSRLAEGTGSATSTKGNVMTEPLEEAHRQFHFSLISGSKMPKLNDLCAQLWSQGERYRRLSYHQDSLEHHTLGDEITHQHQEIVDAAIARDAEKATSLLEAHIDATAKAAIEILSARAVPNN